MARAKSVAVGDLVEVTIPRGQANEDPNFFVSINGKNYLLPRGKKSYVPQEVAYEIERSFRAEQVYYDNARARESGN